MDLGGLLIDFELRTGALFCLMLVHRGAGGSAEVPLRVAAVTFFRFAGKK
jgi:hypothetical protein